MTIHGTRTDTFTDDELPALDDVVSTVDALVSDEPSMLSYPYGIESPMRSGTPNFPPGFGPQVPHHNPNPTPPPGFSRSMTPVSIATANAASFANQAIKPPAPPMPLPIGAGAYTAAKEQSAEAAEAAQAAQAEEQEAVAPIQPPDRKSVV